MAPSCPLIPQPRISLHHIANLARSPNVATPTSSRLRGQYQVGIDGMPDEETRWEWRDLSKLTHRRAGAVVHLLLGLLAHPGWCEIDQMGVGAVPESAEVLRRDNKRSVHWSRHIRALRLSDGSRCHLSARQMGH